MRSTDGNDIDEGEFEKTLPIKRPFWEHVKHYCPSEMTAVLEDLPHNEEVVELRSSAAATTHVYLPYWERKGGMKYYNCARVEMRGVHTEDNQMKGYLKKGTKREPNGNQNKGNQKGTKKREPKRMEPKGNQKKEPKGNQKKKEPKGNQKKKEPKGNQKKKEPKGNQKKKEPKRNQKKRNQNGTKWGPKRKGTKREPKKKGTKREPSYLHPETRVARQAMAVALLICQLRWGWFHVNEGKILDAAKRAVKYSVPRFHYDSVLRWYRDYRSNSW